MSGKFEPPCDDHCSAWPFNWARTVREVQSLLYPVRESGERPAKNNGIREPFYGKEAKYVQDPKGWVDDPYAPLVVP